MSSSEQDQIVLRRVEVYQAVDCPACQSPRGLPCLRWHKKASWTDDGGPGYGPEEQSGLHRARWQAYRREVA